MTLIDELLAKGPALLDGAWGTELQARGLTLGEVPDFWNLEHAERVEQVARAYVEAGADIILTNTFRANNIALANHADVSQLDRVNRAGVEISKRAAGERARVFASIGPSGKLLMRGQVDEASLRKSFEQQARALAAGGADAIVVETMGDLEEARFAIDAARATGLPVAACMVYDSGKKKDRTMMGVPPAQAAEALSEAGADVIGANCGNGIDGHIPICSADLPRRPTDPSGSRPMRACPRSNEERWSTAPRPRSSPRIWANSSTAGASFIGGCCGTNPAFIALLRTRLDARASARRPQ